MGALYTRKVSDLVAEEFQFGLNPEDYPIFDEAYRIPLNTKIIRHYWNYEIGQETESMWRFSLNRKMNEVMPYYNQLYLSTRIQFDPLQTVNYTDFTNTTNNLSGNSSESNNGTAENNNNANNSSRSVQSDTPQVPLSGNEDYASGAVDTNTESTNSGNAATSNIKTDSHNEAAYGSIERTLQGSQGPSAAELLMRFRNTFLNIDMNVIAELNSLFMQVWDNGDEYSRGLNYGLPIDYIWIL